ncbi:hypothetical protein CDAR_390921 [Caerostris darwini]|uniref:Uncharacterized protein n=1 Tax=Caerostris darwini TaxID=1538125 RepID=A0AAV4UAI7_9ARAC|nr:hypothetical protein CDAR_390921 [Caerostris darwini]
MLSRRVLQMSIGFNPLCRGVVPTLWQCSADGTGRFGLRIRHYRNAASIEKHKIKRSSPTKAKEAVSVTSQSPIQQLLACASQLEQIFNRFKVEDSARSEIRDLFLQSHSIRDRQIAIWKNTATKGEALEQAKAITKVAEQVTNAKTCSEVLKRGHHRPVSRRDTQAPPKPTGYQHTEVVLVYGKIEALEDSTNLKQLLERNVSLAKEGITLLSTRN